MSTQVATPLAATVERVPFLRALPPSDLERLRPYLHLRKLEPGAAIWREGDGADEFMFVVEGRAKLVRTSEAGREVIIEMCGSGDLLCASAVCAFAPHCCSALSMQQAVDVVAVPRRDVLELVERSPTAARAFIRELTNRGMSLCERVEELASGQVERRIAMLLARLAEEVGVVREDGTWIPIALSRQDLADLCGTSVETAIRIMTRLAREGVVQTAARGFLVTDVPGLQRLTQRARGGG